MQTWYCLSFFFRIWQICITLVNKYVYLYIFIYNLQPLFGLINAKLELITHAYFDERDFSQVALLEQTFNNLNSSLTQSLLEGTQVFLGECLHLWCLQNQFYLFVVQNPKEQWLLAHICGEFKFSILSEMCMKESSWPHADIKKHRRNKQIGLVFYFCFMNLIKSRNTIKASFYIVFTATA